MFLSFLLAIAGVDSVSLGGIQDSKLDQHVIIALSITLLPLLETLIGQMLPIQIIGLFTSNKRIAVVASIVVFSSLHVLNSLWYVVITVPAACLLAITYVMYRTSIWRAIVVTTLCHAVANAWASLWIVLDGWMT